MEHAGRVLPVFCKMCIRDRAYTGYEGLEWHISNVARIPGNAIMILLEIGKRFPDDTRRDLSYLLKEQVWFVFNTNNPISILSQAIGKGCQKEDIRIQYINDQPRICLLYTSRCV